TASIALAASFASATTRTPGMLSRIATRPSRAMSWSSTTRVRACSPRISPPPLPSCLGHPVRDRHDRPYERPLAAPTPDLEGAVDLRDALAHAEEPQPLTRAITLLQRRQIKPASAILHLQHQRAPDPR